MFNLGALDLAGRRILIVEDEYLVATDVAEAVRRSGGEVVGPVPSVEEALVLLEGERPPDGAILDIKLGDATSFPIARLLEERGVPIIFVTGYDDWFIPQEYDDVPVYRKPMDADNVVRVLFDRVTDKEE